jgi:hypothetical protein
MVVVADRGTDSFSLFTSTADGAKPAREVSMGPDAQPAAGAIADVNGDGYDDLIVSTTKPTFSLGGSSCQVRGCVVVFFGSKTGLRLGLGAKTLVLPLGVEDKAYLPAAIAAGDISGDGKLDIAVGLAGTNEVVLIPGTGRGKFAPPSEYKRVAVPSPVGLLLARSGGKPVVIAMMAGSVSYAVVSFAGAGTLVEQTSSYGELSKLVGSVPPTVVDTARQVAVGDFDGDGLRWPLDVAFLYTPAAGGSGHSSLPYLRIYTSSALFDGPTSLDLGSVSVGSSATKYMEDRQYIVRSDFNADGPITVRAQITGPDASSFSLPTSGCSGSFVSWPCATTVTFTPTSPGAKTATLSLDLDLRNNPIAGNPVKVALTGTGTAVAPSARTPTGRRSRRSSPVRWPRSRQGCR